MASHHFPDEILLDVCKRLPVKAVGRFRCVNKRFCSLLQNPSFNQLHLNHSIEKDKFNLLISSISDDLEISVYSMASEGGSSLVLSVYDMDFPFQSQGPVVEIIGSCNGLICLELNRCHVCIWNPSTTEFKKIQTPPNEFSGFNSTESSRPKRKGHSYGFGYDSKIGDYKLVRFERMEGVMFMSAGSIYTLGTNTWKKVECIRYDVTGGAGQPGVHIDGVLYWIADRTRKVGDGCVCCAVIFSFDVCDESVHEIELPDNLVCVCNVRASLGVFDGNLCLVREIPGIHTEVWVVKDLGENKGNWNKIFTIEKGINYGKPLHSFKTGEIFFELERKEADEPNGMVLYDPKQKRSKVLNIGGTHKLFNVESYVPSLVSLKSGNFVGAGEFEELV